MKKLFFLFAFLLFTQIGFAWWGDGNNWTARKPIPINNSGVGLTDYQVKIELNWTSGMNTTCSDFRFTDNSTNGILLPHWTETCTASVNATVWVKTNLSTGNNTVYVYYGNPSAASASNASNTFIYDLNPLGGGYDFEEASGTTTIDNSGSLPLGTLVNMNTGLNNGSSGWTSSGKFGNAIMFNGGNNYVTVADVLDKTNSDSFTLSAWVKQTRGASHQAAIGKYGGGGSGYELLSMWANDQGLGATDKVGGYYRDGTTAVQLGGGTINTTDNNWHYIVVVRDVTSDKIYTYTDGVHQFNTTDTTTGSLANSIALTFGQVGSNYDWMNGTIDSPRIYNFSLSSTQISTIYNARGYLTQNYKGHELIRNYTSPEPVVLTVGAEETPLITVSLQSPQNATYNTAMIDLNFTLSKNASSCIYELDGVNTSLPTCFNKSYFVYDHNQTSPVCGGDWSGLYPCTNTYDNDINTIGIGIGFSQGWVDLTYNKSNLFNGSRIQIIGNSNSNNITISSSCFSYLVNNLTIRIYSNYTESGRVEVYCYSGIFEKLSTIGTGGYIRDISLFWESRFYSSSLSLNDSSHSIKVWANDSANNWGVSSTVSFTVDTTLPSAAIQLPLNATYNKLNGSVTLNFTTSDNLGVSQCKYELDGVNTSLPTCANATLTLTDGSHRIKVWVNDTANNWNSTSLVYFVSDFTEPTINIQSPSNSTYYNQNLPFNLSLTYTTTDSIGISTCKYELDGAINVTIGSCANTTISVTNYTGHTLRLWVNDTANNWNSSTISFTLVNLTLNNCTSGTKILEFNLKEEENDTALFGNINLFLNMTEYNNKEYPFIWTNTTTASVCVNLPAATFLTDFELDYSKTDYETREYFVQHLTLTNTTTNISLYLIPEADGIETQLTLMDTNGEALSSHLVEFKRYYRGSQTYKTVAMIKTDSFGKSVTWLKMPELYVFKITEDGVILRTYDVTNLVAPTTPPKELTLKLSDYIIEYWTYQNKVSGSCTFTNTTGILACSFSDTSGEVSSTVLSVLKLPLTTKITEVCSNTTASGTGSLSCTISNITNNTFQYTLTAILPSGTKIELVRGNIEYGQPIDFGQTGLLIAFFLSLGAFLLFGFNITAGVLAMNFMLISLKILHIFPMSWGYITIFIILGVLVISKVGGQRGG